MTSGSSWTPVGRLGSAEEAWAHVDLLKAQVIGVEFDVVKEGPTSLTTLRRLVDDLVWATHVSRYLTTEHQALLGWIKSAWERTKDAIPASYHPIMDDRISLCQGYVKEGE